MSMYCQCVLHGRWTFFKAMVFLLVKQGFWICLHVQMSAKLYFSSLTTVVWLMGLGMKSSFRFG